MPAYRAYCTICGELVSGPHVRWVQQYTNLTRDRVIRVGVGYIHAGECSEQYKAMAERAGEGPLIVDPNASN